MRALHAQRKNRVPSAALLLLVGAVALAAASPPAASANQYEVFEVCRKSHDDLTIEDEPVFPDEPLASVGFRVVDKCQPSGDGSISFVVDDTSFQGGKRWVLQAPANTRIRGVSFERISRGPWHPAFVWDVKDANGRLWESVRGVPPPDEFMQHNSPNFDTTVLRGALYCETSLVCPGRAGLTASLEVSQLDVTLEDEFPPRFIGPLGGSLASDGTVRDVGQISYTAADRGAGIAAALLVIDGIPQFPVRDLNGGACEEPYLVLVPCRLKVSSSLSIDTTLLPEGVHEFGVVLVDGAGNLERSAPVQARIHNAPSVVGPPAIEGSPRVGSGLSVSSGTWEGDPSFFSYQWLRCPAQARGPAECTPIPGAITAAYIPSKADRQYRVLVAVTATNFSGSEVAFSGPSQPVGEEDGGNATGLVLRNVRLSRKRFPLSGSPPALRFSSSGSGSLTAAAIRAGDAHAKPLALLVRKIRAGRGTLSLADLFRHREIRPGHYQLLVFAVDAAGNFSRPVRLPFTILSG